MVRTSPNPSVGCIITDESNNTLSTGVTSIHGRPHAEEIAINNLDKENKHLAYNLFITLEPCCYSTNNIYKSCLELILGVKTIRNVYVGLPDPNPNICTKSIKALRSHGFNVYVGICVDEIFETNFGFLKKHMLQLPKISYKIATSLDGKIASGNGNSKWITNEKSRTLVHKLRNQYEAILTTSTTIITDNPELNVRHIKTKTQPARIILDRTLKLFNTVQEWKIFNTSTATKQQVIIVYSIDESKNMWFLKMQFPQIFFLKIENFDLKNVFDKITGNFGFSSILVEAGGKFLTSLIQSDLLDKIYWFYGCKIIGSDGLPSIQKLNLLNITDNFNFQLQEIKKIGNDFLCVFQNDPQYSLIKDHIYRHLKECNTQI